MSYQKKTWPICSGQCGSALIYILIAIALLAALTLTFMDPSGQQSTSQSGFRTSTQIQAQVDTIRSAIQECVLSYRQGDPEIDNSSAGTDPFARKNYPIKPNSQHYDGLAIGPTTGTQYVQDIRCPGNPGESDPNHVKIFGGTTGKYLPAAPDLFEDWQYYNGQDGIFFWTQTNKTDAFLDTALQKLDDTYSECEADIIDATSGSNVPLDSDSPAEVECPTGYKCFRIWMIAKSSAEYNGDTDGEETAANCP